MAIKGHRLVPMVTPIRTPMKSFSLVLLAVLFGGAMGFPDFGIRVPAKYFLPVTRTVQWMVASQMDGDSRVLRFKYDPRCHDCPFLREMNMNRWPEQCNPCIEPFSSKLENISECKKCTGYNEKCGKCYLTLKRIEESQLGKREELAKPFLDRAIFV